MRLRLVSLCSVLVVSVVACGGSDSSPSSIEPQIGSVDLKATREGETTILSADAPVSPKVVIPDTALPDGVSTDDLTGSVTYISDPETGSTAVEFAMGPDGTQFTEPIDLSWIGQTGDDVTTTIMAVNDAGENLLDQEEASSIISTLTSTNGDSDGTGEVSMSVDHFSFWVVIQTDTRVSTYSLGKDFLATEVRLEFDSWIRSRTNPKAFFDVIAELPMGSSGLISPCIDPKVSVSGGAAFSAAVGSGCGSRDYVSRSIYLSCPDITTSGTIHVDFNAYFGMPGLDPLTKFAVLLGSTSREGYNLSGNESAFVASSEIAVFVSGRLTMEYDCAEGAEVTSTTAPTTVESSTTSSTVMSTAVSTTKPTATPTTIPTGTTVATPRPTTLVPPTSAAGNTNSSSSTTTIRTGSTVPQSSTTTDPYTSVPTTPAPSEPAGTWLRNDSRCRWRGTSTCGIYSSGSAMYVEVGPSGGPGQTYTPVAGNPGDLAYNLLSDNTVTDCDWNGSGGCGYYYTGTPGSYTINAPG